MGHAPRTCFIVHLSLLILMNDYLSLSLSLSKTKNMGSLNSSLAHTLMTRFAALPFLPYRFCFLFICFPSFVLTPSDTHLSSTQYCRSQVVKAVSMEVNLFYSHTQKRKQKNKKKMELQVGEFKKES